MNVARGIRSGEVIDGVQGTPQNPSEVAPSPAPGFFDKPLTHCAAGSDGDCTHPQCPQIRDGEPKKTGRHCPIDNREDY